MKYYHATDFDNYKSILKHGIRIGVDHLVYLCTSAFDALKFAAVHMVEKALVIEVELDEKDVIETFDHSESFFQCKCYGYNKNIAYDKMINFTVYNLSGEA